MQDDQTEVRRHLATTAARASAPQFTTEDVAVRVWRVRRRQARIGTMMSVAAVAVAAAVVVPLALGGTRVTAPVAAGHKPAGGIAPGTGTGTGTTPGKPMPSPPWTVTVNGQALGVPESLADGYTGEPQFDVAPGEKVTITLTITVPVHTEMAKFFLGITGDTAGLGPQGPIGMEPTLATAPDLAAGPHKFTVRWTVPASTAPKLGYQLATATFWSKATKNEPEAEAGPLVDFGVTPGAPVPSAAATKLQAQAFPAVKNHGDAKPDWIVAVRTTFAQAMAAVDRGGKVPTVNPGTPVYVYLGYGDFETGAGSYISAIIDAKTFSVYESGLSHQGPALPLASLGPLASLTGGQPARG